MLFKSFYAFRCVGHGVGQAVDPHFDPHLKVHFCNEKHPKSEDFRCFLELLTRFELDLILTKDALYRLSYSSEFGDPERARTVDL